MTFKEWADRTFGENFKDEGMAEMLCYFRMSAAWDASRKELDNQKKEQS